MTEQPPFVRPIEGEDLLAWIRRNEVRSYRYKPNVPGNYFLISCALILSMLAVVLVLWKGFARPIHIVTIMVLLGGAFSLVGLVLYWFRFVVRSYVALTDDELLIGYGKSGHILQRAMLTRQHVRVEDMKAGNYTMVLPIVVGAQSWRIHLVGPFANLGALQAFIAEMLTQFLEEEDDDDQAATKSDGGVDR